MPERATTGRVRGQVVFKCDAACDRLGLGGVQGVGGQGEEEEEGGTEGGRGGSVVIGGVVAGKVGGVDGGLWQELG